MRPLPVTLGDAIAFSFTPQGTGLEDIAWSISRDDGQTWSEAQTGIPLPSEGVTKILLKAELKIVEGHEPPSVTGLDWVFISERETSERYTFTSKERDASGLYYFGARYYDPEVGRFISEDPIKDGSNWHIYCFNNPILFIDQKGLWGGYRENHTTITLSVAKYVGFSQDDAMMIAIWNEWVDNPNSGICPVPGIGDPSWHFDTNSSPIIDSRRDCLENARVFTRTGSKDMALAFIGMGLHAIQDVSAHDSFDIRQLPNIHPSQYDNPDLDFNRTGRYQRNIFFGNGGYLEFVHGTTRLDQCYKDTYNYLILAWSIIFPEGISTNNETITIRF